MLNLFIFIFFFRPEEDHLNSYVKPELLKRIQKAFPVDFKNDVLSRNKCRDMIIECVQFSMRVCICTKNVYSNLPFIRPPFLN